MKRCQRISQKTTVMVLALKREFTFMSVAMSGIFMPCKLVDEFFSSTSKKDEYSKER